MSGTLVNRDCISNNVDPVIVCTTWRGKLQLCNEGMRPLTKIHRSPGRLNFGALRKMDREGLADPFSS
jgi:hypothetical protein